MTPSTADRRLPRPSLLFLTAIGLICAAATPQLGFCQSALEKALKFKPTQPVEIDTPDPANFDRCKLEETDTAVSKPGWIVYDESGRIIRRLLDTNDDRVLDQLSYFRNGIEVYRDIDSNFDKKFEEMRWFGTAGTRWGLDENQDGKIDSWKVISAEEVSSETVEAIKTADLPRFEALLISTTEISEAGLGDVQSREVSRRVDAARAGFSEFCKSQRMIDRDSVWIQFGGMRPGVVPSGTSGSTADVTIYDSVTAVVDSGNRQHVQLSIGTLIRSGDAWRLVDLPELIVEGQPIANGGMFYQSNPESGLAAVASSSGDGASDEEQRLFEIYEQLDARIQNAGKSELPALHQQRAELYVQMADASQSPENRSNWLRQMADMVSSAYRNGEFPDGNEFLAKTIANLKAQKADSDDIAYAEYRRLTNLNSRQLEEASSSEYESLQKKHLTSLREFVEQYPKADPSSEAMLQIGLQDEFDGNIPEAMEWYSRISRDFPDTASARKARGANTRLGSEGKVIAFRGKTLDGKQFDLSSRKGRVVLLQYWATWCEPCKDDLRLIKQAFEKYRDRNFEVVSISLDNSDEIVRNYLKTENLPWFHLYEDGGLDSPLAEQLGVSVVPTMILVGADGTVIDRNVSAVDLDKILSREFKKR
jgi:thiol-disulfide isomerase/thioredoxin